MRVPKRYGQSRVDRCPFCSKQGTTMNEQGVPVCHAHKEEMLDLKCACGSWLEIRSGKYGAYCHCMNCGNINLKKAISMNTVEPKATAKEELEDRLLHRDKEMTVRSDDPDYFSD